MRGAVNVETEKWCMYVYAVSFPGCSSVWICEWCLVYMETCISCMGDVNSITTVYLHLLVPLLTQYCFFGASCLVLQHK